MNTLLIIGIVVAVTGCVSWVAMTYIPAVPAAITGAVSGLGGVANGALGLVAPVTSFISANPVVASALTLITPFVTGGLVYAVKGFFDNRRADAKALENSQLLNDVQSQAFQAQNKALDLAHTVKTVTSENEVLKGQASTVEAVTAQLTSAQKLIDTKTAEVNTLTRMMNDERAGEIAQKKFEELKKVP